MTKADFVQAIKEYAQKHYDADVTNVSASRALDAVSTCARDALLAGEEVTLPGIGKLKIVERGARSARNPKTGAPIDVPAGKKVVLRVGKEMKDAMNG